MLCSNQVVEHLIISSSLAETELQDEKVFKMNKNYEDGSIKALI